MSTVVFVMLCWYTSDMAESTYRDGYGAAIPVLLLLQRLAGDPRPCRRCDRDVWVVLMQDRVEFIGENGMPHGPECPHADVRPARPLRCQNVECLDCTGRRS